MHPFTPLGSVPLSVRISAVFRVTLHATAFRCNSKVLCLLHKPNETIPPRLFQHMTQQGSIHVYIWVLREQTHICYQKSLGVFEDSWLCLKQMTGESRESLEDWVLPDPREAVIHWTRKKRREWVNMSTGKSQKRICSQKLKIKYRGSRTFEPYGKELKDIL